MRHTRERLRHAWLMGLLVSLTPSGVTAASTPEAQPYRYVAVIPGDCERLILAGRDRTVGCSDKLVNVDFGDGRVAFVFTSPSESGPVVTTFLGRASIQNDLRSYRLEVDEISTTTIDAAGNPANVVESAAGHCVMLGDPIQERARFECTAERPSGATAATFLSAGEPTVYAGPAATQATEKPSPSILLADPCQRGGRAGPSSTIATRRKSTGTSLP